MEQAKQKRDGDNGSQTDGDNNSGQTSYEKLHHDRKIYEEGYKPSEDTLSDDDPPGGGSGVSDKDPEDS